MLITFQMEQIKKIKKSTSQLTKTNNDLVELGNTLGKVTKVFVIAGFIFQIHKYLLYC